MTREEATHLSDVLKAYSEGKPIQRATKGKNDWWISDYPTFEFDRYDYRIKPEPKYRPYKNAEEFLKAQKEHGMYLISKNKRDRARFPVIVEHEKILMFWEPKDSSLTGYMYSDLLNYWTHQDGTPCGIFVDELENK